MSEWLFLKRPLGLFSTPFAISLGRFFFEVTHLRETFHHRLFLLECTCFCTLYALSKISQNWHWDAKNLFQITSELWPLALSGYSYEECTQVLYRHWWRLCWRHCSDLLSGSCWVSICASVGCFCVSEAEGCVTQKATRREQAGCSLSRQTMWVSYLTSSNRTWQ